jgi:hypothetical protein
MVSMVSAADTELDIAFAYSRSLLGACLWALRR